MRLTLRRLSILLITIGVVTSVIYGTGAFDSFLTSREAAVSVTGDATGYVGFHPGDGPNGKYATYENGKLQLQLSRMANGHGSGVNAHGRTTIENVFLVRNQGAVPASLWLGDTSEHVTFERGRSGESFESKAGAVRLRPGEEVAVSVVIDTSTIDPGTTLRPALTFHATTEDVGAADGSPDRGENQPDGSAPVSTPKDKKDTGNGNSNDQSQKKSNNDGGWLDKGADWVNNNVVEPVSDTVETISSVGEDYWDNINNWSRQQVLDKISYVTNQPVDALQSLGESAWNTVVGFVLGEFGMPGGAYTAREANSPFYLGGAFLAVVNPITDTVAGVRDFVSYLLKGKVVGAAIEAVGLFPVAGTAQDVHDLSKITKKWVDDFPGEARKLGQSIRETFLVHMPSEVRNTLSKLIPNRKATKTVDSDSRKINSVEITRIAKEHKDIGYTTKDVESLAKSTDVTTGELKELAEEGISFKHAKAFKNGELSNADIKTLYRSDINLDAAGRLSQEGFTGEQLIFFAKFSDDTPITPTMEELEELRKIGYDPSDLLSIYKDNKRKYIRKSATPQDLASLNGAGFSSSQAKHISIMGYNSDLMVHLAKYREPGQVINYIESFEDIDHGAEYEKLYRNTKSWCATTNINSSTVDVCRKLPHVPYA